MARKGRKKWPGKMSEKAQETRIKRQIPLPDLYRQKEGCRM
jgi:hypothetical protein